MIQVVLHHSMQHDVITVIALDGLFLQLILGNFFHSLKERGVPLPQIAQTVSPSGIAGVCDGRPIHVGRYVKV